MNEILFTIGMTVFWILVFVCLNFFNLVVINSADWLNLIACILISAVASSWIFIHSWA